MSQIPSSCHLCLDKCKRKYPYRPIINIPKAGFWLSGVVIWQWNFYLELVSGNVSSNKQTLHPFLVYAMTLLIWFSAIIPASAIAKTESCSAVPQVAAQTLKPTRLHVSFKVFASENITKSFLRCLSQATDYVICIDGIANDRQLKVTGKIILTFQPVVSKLISQQRARNFLLSIR